VRPTGPGPIAVTIASEAHEPVVLELNAATVDEPAEIELLATR
jgi:hypothetical protein